MPHTPLVMVYIPKHYSIFLLKHHTPSLLSQIIFCLQSFLFMVTPVVTVVCTTHYYFVVTAVADADEIFSNVELTSLSIIVSLVKTKLSSK